MTFSFVLVSSPACAGNEHRSIATTKMNEASSRSHSLLVVNIVKTVQPSAENPRGERKRSSLTLVDLAGSVRSGRRWPATIRPSTHPHPCMFRCVPIALEPCLGVYLLLEFIGRCILQERLSRSEAKGSAMKEAQHINKSLSALADVIAARAQKAAHVPYRNSKLTSLLEVGRWLAFVLSLARQHAVAAIPFSAA